MNKHLFLFGGSPPFTSKMAQKFVKEASGKKAPVSILFVEREGWQAYMPKYTQLLEQAGLHDFHYLPFPSTSIEKTIDYIKNSSGIIIGGGNTNLYADYIVDTAISSVIKESYISGIPVAGFSAGALISPDTCVISPKDNDQHEYQERKGLALISNVLVAVHFTQWQDEAHLKNVVSKYSNHKNYGIDENTGIYFLNGHLEATEGDSVFYIKDGALNRINNTF